MSYSLNFLKGSIGDYYRVQTIAHISPKPCQKVPKVTPHVFSKVSAACNRRGARRLLATHWAVCAFSGDGCSMNQVYKGFVENHIGKPVYV